MKMAERSPDFIARWLDANLHRFENPAQFLGTEPGAARKPWEQTTLRWLVAASWPYYHSTGNQSIPAVCATVNNGREGYYADRFYLPEVPRDLHALERGGIPVFGIESKHQALDFDVIGTSISYAVLWMNFAKMLRMSSIPLRWRDREARAGDYPMIVAGGQACRGPGFMEPVADCVFLGEVEDEPGNGGLTQVNDAIAIFKQQGTWISDRIACYRELAREFSYLYFPRFVEVSYRYEDRGLEHPSKQVAGYRSLLDGMTLPRRSRVVKNLDDIAPLTEAPLLYSDPRMGAGDIEVGRGCIGEDEYVFLPGRGIQRLGDFAGDMMHPAGLEAVVRRDSAWVSHVLDNGQREVVRVQTRQGHAITCTPDHRIWTDRGWVEAQFLTSGDKLPVYYGQRVFGPEQDLDAAQSALPASANYRHPVDGQRSGNRANAFTEPAKLTPELAWLLGFLTGDGGIYGDGKCVFFMTRIEEPEVAEFVHRWMFRLFGLHPVIRDRPGVPVLYHFYFSTPLVRWLCGNFGYSPGKATEHSKLYVPEKVLQSPRNVQESYLLGLFEADLYCADRPKAPKFSTISERLARQMSAMLLNLGVPCSFHSKVRTSAKGYGGTDWEILLRRAGDADTGWLRLLARWKDDQLSWYRSTEKAQGSKFHLRRDYLTAVVRDVTQLEAPIRVLDLHVPVQEAFNASGFVVHNCDAWCTFCALGWNTNPPRERSVGKSVEHARQWQRNMGGRELSPFSPDFPMHRQKKRLLAALLSQVNSSIDVTAMRIDDFNKDSQYVLIQARAGADGVTLGLEGDSQRMRDLVGKGTADADVAEAVTRGIRAGFRKFKLFMITALPGSEPGDVMKIVELAQRLVQIRAELSQPHVIFQFSWTPLLVESQTPMQWFAPTPPDHTLIKVAEAFKDLPNVQLKIGTKSLVNGTPVLTPSGFVRVESLRVGDPIVDPDGYRSQVLNVWDNDPEPIYRLTFSDGSEIEAGAGHLWDVFRWHGTSRSADRKQGAEVREHLVTTEQLCELVGKSPMAPWLPDSLGLQYENLGDGRQCTVDPYLLGVILGDGSLGRTLKITTADPEILKWVSIGLPDGVHLVSGKPKSQATDYCLSVEGGGSTINPLGEQLRALGLCCQRSWEKFVPDSYKLAPASFRLAVLQGLMDTDGCRPSRGSAARFSSASRQLRDDVLWLARSLGLAASARDGQQATFTLKNGERRTGRPVYLCTIWETPDIRVFRLTRKLLPLGRPKHRVLRSVEYVRDEATRCIEVSAPSARFVVGDGQFIPTHNAEPNKVSLFQLCQRASRDVGEAITDVFEELDTACWGGVPKDTRERLEAALVRHGFANGFGDCFDERGRWDLFGWDWIRMGTSPDMMWEVYAQMVEFLEGTSADTYEEEFGGPAGGNEWVTRCDQSCQGNRCGVCDPADLRLRAARVAGTDIDADLSRLKVIDQETVAVKIRAGLVIPPENRYASREHWRYAIRRAAYRAQHDMDWKTGIAKDTIAFASDNLRHRDWTCGADCVEFGLTVRFVEYEIEAFILNMAAELDGWAKLGRPQLMPAAANIRRDAAVSLWDLEIDDPEKMAAWLRGWDAADYVKLVFRSESAYFGAGSTEVNAKDYLHDAWLARDGHAWKLRMLAHVKAGPYTLYAALAGKPSWLEAAARPAVRLGMFAASKEHDVLRISCQGCGEAIPADLLGLPFNRQLCPRCADESAGLVTAGLVRRSRV